MRRILLTGAGPHGFIGKNIAPQLRTEYELFTPGSRELNLVDYDATARYLDEHRIDTVIHGAAQSLIHTGPEDVMLHDLQMFYNLDKLSRQMDRFLFFGSGAVFDKRIPVDRVTEEDVGRSIPQDYYGLCKYIMTLHARQSRNIYNLRLFGIFGPYEHWQSKFISNLCCKAVYGLPLTVRQNAVYDFLYVRDLPPIVEWFLENEPKHHDYNICTGTPTDLVTIAKTVREVSGKDLPIDIKAEGWGKPYTAVNGRLISETGPLTLHTMDEAIGELYAYYEAHREEIPLEILKETR